MKYLIITSFLLFTLCTNAQQKIEVGVKLGGGIVGYILQKGDEGFIPNETHGLIVSEIDLGESIRWFHDLGSITTTGAYGSDIGTGKSNTDLIVKSQVGNLKRYAAGLTRLYKGGGFEDWFLPSIEELNKIYVNREKIGNMSNAWYWSSSEGPNFNAWFLDFKFGIKELDLNSRKHVRAIRCF